MGSDSVRHVQALPDPPHPPPPEAASSGVLEDPRMMRSSDASDSLHEAHAKRRLSVYSALLLGDSAPREAAPASLVDDPADAEAPWRRTKRQRAGSTEHLA